MSKITNCLINKDTSCIPIWFMRQAGRYLPEFREIRSKNPDFIKLCLNSDLSSEITLQPLDRFDLDAAIIFSDILMVPFGLGQKVEFIKGKGPKLSEFNMKAFLDNDESNFTKRLNPVYQAIRNTRKKLSKEKSLISFIGAPWTLIVYMMGLRQDKKNINLENIKKDFEKDLILEKLNKFLCLHIKNQMNAGADVVQIFDSWAGIIPDNEINDYCFTPNKKLVDFCKEINLPVISFPKGIGEKYKKFLEIVRPDGINIDYDIDPKWAKDNLKNVCLQGGMDPKILFEDEKKINFEVDKYLDNFRNTPYIFNLGHGLLPETNPDTLAKIINRVKSYK
jgi:uroporphyrinogen decarboxylase